MTRHVSRRGFLKSGAAVAASAVLAGCGGPSRWYVLEPYVRPPEEQPTGVATWYASTCRQCPAGCGIIVRVMNGRALKIEGNPEHPLNQGKLCAQGQAGLQLLYHPDRLRGPVQRAQRGSGQWQNVSWDQALGTLADRLQGAGSGMAVIAGSSTSGHLYDLWQRFTKALGGQPPLLVDLQALVTGYPVLSGASNSLFGRPDLPYYDLGSADVVFSFGADFLAAGPSTTRYGIDFGRFRTQGLGKRGLLVQFEPRMSLTGAKADRWVAVRPGTEGLVAQAIARLIGDQNLGPGDRVARARNLAGSVDLTTASRESDVSLATLTSLARAFGNAQHPIAIPGSALAGLDNAATAVSAVQSLNWLAGGSGQPGGFGLSVATPGPAVAKPVTARYADVQSLIERMRAGQVKALLVYGANPAYELPVKAGFMDALRGVPFVVSFSPILDETAAQADLILPDRTYLESWGYEVVAPNFGSPAITSQQPVVAPLYNTRATGDVLLAAAQRIPAVAPSLPWSDEVSLLKDTVTRLPAAAYGGTGADVQWARFLQHGGWWPATAPAAAAAPPAAGPAGINVAPANFQGDSAQYPYYLCLYMSPLVSSGWSASLPWLQGSPDPMTSISWQTWVEIHPDTAQKLRVQKNDIVRVTTPQGQLELPVYVYPAIRPDTIAIPFGRGHSEGGRYARGNGANPLQLVGPQADSSGNSLAWASLRAQVTRTGRKTELATFEWTPGVEQGFANQAFPGA